MFRRFLISVLLIGILSSCAPKPKLDYPCDFGSLEEGQSVEYSYADCPLETMNIIMIPMPKPDESQEVGWNETTGLAYEWWGNTYKSQTGFIFSAYESPRVSNQSLSLLWEKGSSVTFFTPNSDPGYSAAFTEQSSVTACTAKNKGRICMSYRYVEGELPVVTVGFITRPLVFELPDVSESPRGAFSLYSDEIDDTWLPLSVSGHTVIGENWSVDTGAVTPYGTGWTVNADTTTVMTVLDTIGESGNTIVLLEPYDLREYKFLREDTVAFCRTENAVTFCFAKTGDSQWSYTYLP